MIPILYEKTETDFNTNGLGRLRDCISCIVTEERNGIYECDFDYPITGAYYEEIQLGRIIGVTHDDSGDVQPFDIVSYSKPIDGIVSFHCVHISYRQSYLTTFGTNINTISDAFTMLSNAQPSNPFFYVCDYYPVGYMSAGNGLPYSVRELLGGTQGSILDTYGGEYEWDKWTVYWHQERGRLRDFSIRYGVNMLDYNDETDIQGTFSSCIPFWTDGTTKVVGTRVFSNGTTITGRGECVPLDLSEKFENEPTAAQLDLAAEAYMNRNNTFIPKQTIHVEFIRLQDMGEYSGYEGLLDCKLCDTITVIYPDFNSTTQYKIVRTVWDALQDRYESMELGDLSVTLAEALGISNSNERTSDMTDFVVAQGTDGIWTYRKWNSGVAEIWGTKEQSITGVSKSAPFSGYCYAFGQIVYPTGFFISPPTAHVSGRIGSMYMVVAYSASYQSAVSVELQSNTSGTQSCYAYIYSIGRWK